MIKKSLFKVVVGLIMLQITTLLLATELQHWPVDAANKLNALISQHAHKGEFAVFDMDNTSYRHDLETALIPFLEKKGVLTREKLDPSLKIVPFIDSGNEKESLVGYYLRLCEIDDIICYPWASQVFSGFTLKELKGYVDELIADPTPISIHYFNGEKFVEDTVLPPKMFTGMQELYNKLQENGIEVYVMTAANEELVRMVASDPKYGYNVKPENVIGVNQLLKDRKTGKVTTSRLEIKRGHYDPVKHLELELTSYLVNPMTWFEGKAGSILGWISAWRKPVLVGGDTVGSDTYMLLNSVDLNKGGLRLWINRSKNQVKKLQYALEQAAIQQQQSGHPITAQSNWLYIDANAIE